MRRVVALACLLAPALLGAQSVTIRERDTMSQERVSLDKVEGYLAARLIGA